MNRFTNLDIYGGLYADGKGNFGVFSNDQVIDWIETLRKANGQNDFIADSNYENDIYYNFSVEFDFSKKEVKLIGVPFGTEQDDCVYYECQLTPEEKEYIMWLIIYELSKENA